MDISKIGKWHGGDSDRTPVQISSSSYDGCLVEYMEEKNTAGQVQYQPVIAILGGMSILSRLRHHPTLCSGMSFLKKLKRENEHWAVLGMSRSEYAVKRPWKVAGVSCVTFEDVTVLVPGEVIADLKFHAEAELLLENVFSKELCSTNERPCPVLTVILDR